MPANAGIYNFLCSAYYPIIICSAMVQTEFGYLKRYTYCHTFNDELIKMPSSIQSSGWYWIMWEMQHGKRVCVNQLQILCIEDIEKFKAETGVSDENQTHNQSSDM